MLLLIGGLGPESAVARPPAPQEAPAHGYRDAEGKWRALPSSGASAAPNSADTRYPAPAAPEAVQAGPPAASGPQGSSRLALGEERYDEVGYAGVLDATPDNGPPGAVTITHRTLAPGAYVELTSLDNGRTILSLVTGPSTGDLLDLSPAAGQLLGANGNRVAVRVRKVMPSPEDQSALAAGRAASPRIDAPQVLVTALRRRLPSAPAVAASPAPAPVPAPATTRPQTARPAAPVRRIGYYVQVAALSNAANADTLARGLGGFVRAGGGYYRVQMGPFPDNAAAQRARAKAVARGYGDARIFAQN